MVVIRSDITHIVTLLRITMMMMMMIPKTRVGATLMLDLSRSQYQEIRRYIVHQNTVPYD